MTEDEIINALVSHGYSLEESIKSLYNLKYKTFKEGCYMSAYTLDSEFAEMLRTHKYKDYSKKLKALQRVGQEITSCHPNNFKSGEWFTIESVMLHKPENRHPRFVYVVAHPQGYTDLWAVEDPSAKYQFRSKA